MGETTMNRKEYEDRLAEKKKEIDKIEDEISACIPVPNFI